MLLLFASDGARIAYRDEGRGVPLVLLHGLMAHGGFFREQDALADHFRLIRIDLRGHGASARDGDRSNVEQIAADVAELAAALDLHDAIGVGWSLGATVLWHVLTGPTADRFAGAVVVDMTARVLNDADWDLGLSAEACEARSAAIRKDFESFAVAAGQAILAQPVENGARALADWASFEFTRNDPATIAALWASLVRQDVRQLEGIAIGPDRPAQANLWRGHRRPSSPPARRCAVASPAPAMPRISKT